MTSTSSSPPYTVSAAEATSYYSGLCSSPRLVYRSSWETTPWTMPTGPEAYRQLKELRPVFGHKLNTVWTTDLGPKVCQLLDSRKVVWTSIDIVCFIKVGEGEVVGPVVIWIGVAPGTLLAEDAHTSADGCLDLLKEFGITDVEVEFRESIYTLSAGPNLLDPASDLDPDFNVRSPLTPVLGLSIAAKFTPHIEGTGGIYFAEGGDSEKVLLVTTRHTLVPANNKLNIDYTQTNTNGSRHDVLFLGTGAFDKFLGSIKTAIKRHHYMVEHCERLIGKLQATVARKDKEAAKRLEWAQQSLDDARKGIMALERLYDESKEEWSDPSQRILGHIIHSPPITYDAGVGGFTEDYAIVELDGSKIKDAFRGNVIDLDMKPPFDKFITKMYPRTAAPPNLEYLDDRFLPLQDIISEDLMRKPDMLDHRGESCLFVIKNGSASGVTFGRATGVFSYTRKYYGDSDTHHTSTEWAILPYDSNSGAFSVGGDSGSIIADGRGRIGGLLTGGARAPDSTSTPESVDITYATPFFWLWPRIKNRFPNAHLSPVMN